VPAAANGHLLSSGGQLFVARCPCSQIILQNEAAIRGRLLWGRTSTIRGHAARGEGILRNRLDIGRARLCATTRSYHPENGTKRSILTLQDEVEVQFPPQRIGPRALLTEFMSSIEQGAPYRLFKARTEERDGEITEIEDRLARAKARLVAREAVQVNVAQVYADTVHQLETLLGDPDLVEQARGFLGMLVHRNVLTPDPAAIHGVAAVIETGLGSLAPGSARDDDRDAIAQRLTPTLADLVRRPLSC